MADKLSRRTLGRTDIELSEVTLGTWGLSGGCGPIEERLFIQTVEAAWNAGVTSFDCAPLWGDSERVLGDALKGREAQIITRAGVDNHEGNIARRFDAESLRASCERSLQALGRERLDVWLLHAPAEAVLQDDEVIELASKLKTEGKIGAFGVTTHEAETARMAMTAGADVLCLPVHILASDDLDDLSMDLELSPMGVLARSPLAHGLLSGRWTEYRRFNEDDHRAARWTPQALALRVRQVNQLRFLVHDEVPNMASAALRFVLSRPHVSSAILGARRPAQIAGCVAMAGNPPYLDETDRARIGQVLAAAGA